MHLQEKRTCSHSFFQVILLVFIILYSRDETLQYLLVDCCEAFMESTHKSVYFRNVSKYDECKNNSRWDNSLSKLVDLQICL